MCLSCYEPVKGLIFILLILLCIIYYIVLVFIYRVFTVLCVASDDVYICILFVFFDTFVLMRNLYKTIHKIRYFYASIRKTF